MRIPHWYAAHTNPRAERVVTAYLTGYGIENYLPLYRKLTKWRNGQRVELELPLFPGYVFVRIPLTNRRGVLEIPGIVSLCSSGTVPVPVGDDEIEILRAGLSQAVAEPHPFLAVGDRVRIKAGPFSGLEGFLVQKRGTYRFVLSIDLMMQSVSLEVNAFDVEPLFQSSRPGSELRASS